MPRADSYGTCSCGRPLVRVDVAVFTLWESALQVFLVQRRQPPHEGKWSMPGRIIDPEEQLDAAAERTLQALTDRAEVYLEQLYTYGEPGRDPRGRVITVGYFAVVPTQDLAAQPAAKDRAARWWPVRDLPPLAFDHAQILTYALIRLRYKLEYTAVAFELLPETFTLTELQSAYEIVLGEDLDKRNFRRKILSAHVIEPIGRYRTGEGRPARLYRYRDDAVAEIKARRLFP